MHARGRSTLFSLLLPLTACATPASFAADAVTTTPADEAATREHYDREIFQAVLAGLYRDGVGNDVVDAITALDPQTGRPVAFVYGCPICMPALHAFQAYRTRPRFFGDKAGRDTFGPGLQPAIGRALTGADRERRQRALQALVQGWLEARQRELRLTANERAAWREEMVARKRRGGELLQSYRAQGTSADRAWMETCALCEAADGACRLP